MKITVLIENTVFSKNLTAEHGLSLLIEMDGKKILFDTGQDGNFIKNAENLGIDMSQVDRVIISHGHYDHAGGLEPFCRINQKASIYIKEGFFTPKYKNKEEFIGIKNDKALFSHRIRFVKDVTEIYPGFFVIPNIDIKNVWDTHFTNMFIKDSSGFLEDTFTDEQFIVIIRDKKMNIISGCSHRGISNIIQSARTVFQIPIDLVLGGFHLKDADNDLTGKLISELLKYNIGKIGVCHCTGIEKYAIMKESLKDKVFYNFTGNTIEI